MAKRVSVEESNFFSTTVFHFPKKHFSVLEDLVKHASLISRIPVPKSDIETFVSSMKNPEQLDNSDVLNPLAHAHYSRVSFGFDEEKGIQMRVHHNFRGRAPSAVDSGIFSREHTAFITGLKRFLDARKIKYSVEQRQG